ncbi:MAG: SirB1 family protein [[Pasteurella] mairii]|uniref:Prenyltransferase n=1 Tax=[Pasteurella] mairii TaxID=757 RepID=A0A379B4M8_9PAST|nr:SirB1 family protein [[Pasteurella] mairii]SUB33461.1 prenyltransferase [[Pasteurella] mairii]
MKYKKQALYLEMESFYLCTTADGGEDLRTIRSLMGGLVRKARKAIPADFDVKEKIHRLLQLMYGDWGFYCDRNSYFRPENLYLSYVLRSKQGMPVSLGCILLYLADKLDLPIYPVLFPTQLILRADVDGKVAFIDPWNGKYVSQDYLQTLYEGAFGFGATLTAEELEPADEGELVARFSQLAKTTLIREEHNTEALRYIDNLLWRYPNDPYEIRDRGLVLAQMGCFNAAAKDIEFFIEKCPEDPTALLLAGQISELKQTVESIH